MTTESPHLQHLRQCVACWRWQLNVEVFVMAEGVFHTPIGEVRQFVPVVVGQCVYCSATYSQHANGKVAL